MKRLALAALVVVAACDRSQDVVVGDDFLRVLDPLKREATALDVLMVVDTSASIEPEQQALIDAAGQQLFGQLADENGALPDLHVGFVSTSVSIHASVGGCAADDTVDDGRLRLGQVGTGCPSITGNYLSDVSDGAGGRTRNYTGTLTDAFACGAIRGTDGCGFEHPIEAARRALDGRHGENTGFLRDDALLLVVFLTDEDDCSVRDPAFFGDQSAGLTSPLGPFTSFRCFEFGVVCDPDDPRSFGEKTDCVARAHSPYLVDIDEYRDFFRTLKPDPSLVMLAGMYAPPAPVVVVPDVIGPPFPLLQSSCAAPGTGVEAAPAVRLDALVNQFPSRFVFESICDSAMSQRLYRITRSAEGVMSRRPCLLGPLAPDTTTERCRAFDVGPDGNQAPVQACKLGDRNCFDIVPSAQCDYTPSGLAASYRGTLADGHRLVVDCLARAD